MRTRHYKFVRVEHVNMNETSVLWVVFPPINGKPSDSIHWGCGLEGRGQVQACPTRDRNPQPAHERLWRPHIVSETGIEIAHGGQTQLFLLAHLPATTHPPVIWTDTLHSFLSASHHRPHTAGSEGKLVLVLVLHRLFNRFTPSLWTTMCICTDTPVLMCRRRLIPVLMWPIVEDWRRANTVYWNGKIYTQNQNQNHTMSLNPKMFLLCSLYLVSGDCSWCIFICLLYKWQGHLDNAVVNQDGTVLVNNVSKKSSHDQVSVSILVRRKWRMLLFCRIHFWSFFS